MQAFESALLMELQEQCRTVFAWTLLPNHYHALVDTSDVKCLLRGLGRLHGRSSFEWNGEEGRRGRKVWFNAAETAMKSERHFWATMNYVLHNAVRHGYVERWTDWLFAVPGPIWKPSVASRRSVPGCSIPPLDYGDDWDPPEL